MFFSTEPKDTYCLLEKFIRKQQFSFSLLNFWGHFFGAPIMFECYNFQSRCNPDMGYVNEQCLISDAYLQPWSIKKMFV